MNTKTSSSRLLEAISYLDALKLILKERAITYADLADSLQCSLPTIKRALNKSSMPLDRLLEIANIAGVSLAEICHRADQLRPRHFVFNAAQEQLFVERGELLAYFVELATAEMTPREISKKHDLDARSTATYLRHLERVGLIKRRARNQVKILVQPPFGFAAGGPYLKSQFKKFLADVVANVVDANPPKPNSTAILKPLVLSDQDHEQMLDELIKLVDRFAAISERKIGSRTTSRWQLAIACAPEFEVQPIELPRIGK